MQIKDIIDGLNVIQNALARILGMLDAMDEQEHSFFTANLPRVPRLLKIHNLIKLLHYYLVIIQRGRIQRRI